MVLPTTLAVGCMPTEGEARWARSSAELPRPARLDDSQLPREPPPALPPAEELAPTSRPRLSQTLTLGTPTAAYEDRGFPSGQAPQTANQPTVVVNNYITQQQTAVGGMGMPYRYGYGQGYPLQGRDGVAPRYTPTVTVPTQSMPRVGGDWPRPPSYGPAQMR